MSPTRGVLPQIHHLSFRDLRTRGDSRREIARKIEAGVLLRARASVYVPGDAPPSAFLAAAAGGRVTCTSALEIFGIFVEKASGLHMHLRPNGVLRADLEEGDHVHWQRLVRMPHPRSLMVHPIDALIHSVECQTPRGAIASIDSALNKGILHEDDLDTVFGAVPAHKRMLRLLVDGNAEAGTETFVRLMVRLLGGRVQLQVVLSGVGRVDMVVDGWLVIECDSKAHHSSWEAQREDRRRDLALAARGMVSIRPIAEDILHHPEVVVAAIRGLLGGVRPIDPEHRGGSLVQVRARSAR